MLKQRKVKPLTKSILENLDYDKIETFHFYYNDRVVEYYKKKLEDAQAAKNKLTHLDEPKIITSIIFNLHNAEINYKTVCDNFELLEKYAVELGVIDDPMEWIERYRGD